MSDGAASVATPGERAATSVAWVVLCEAVARDETRRLSLIGIASHLPVPSLPMVLNEHTIVARLALSGRREQIDVSFGVRTPSGSWITPAADDAMSIEVSGEYVIITLRSLPLRSEGIHSFAVCLDNGSSASVDVPVWVCVPSEEDARVH